MLKEPFHLNILKNAFAGRGYIPGAWLDTLKAHIFAGRMDELITVSTHGGTEKVRVSRLKEELVITTPGQSVAFVTDISCSPENIAALKGPAKGADMLFIEAYYLHELKDHAAARGHLTARQAGMIAGILGPDRSSPCMCPHGTTTGSARSAPRSKQHGVRLQNPADQWDVPSSPSALFMQQA